MSIIRSHRPSERIVVDGTELHAAVVNEQEARVAAGITSALGAVAFVYANFDKLFWPIRTVSTFFFVDFLLRVTLGLDRSPTGVVSRWLTRRQAPQWVSAKPKRFAWTLGLMMSGAMVGITNVNIHGWLPRSLCLLCLTLMWMESVLGFCLGCKIYALMVQHGLRGRDDEIELCAGGVCEVPAAKRLQSAPLPIDGAWQAPQI